MEELEQIIYKNGFIYIQSKRNGHAAIYSQYILEEDIRDEKYYLKNKKPIAYEVFRIKTLKDRVIFDKEYSAKECFPSNEEFGSIAWVYKTLDLANKKFETIKINQK